jgi:predicted dehydrogenase
MIYFPPVQSLKRKLDRGELGEIYHVECLKIIRRSFKRGWHRRKEIGGGGAGMDSAPHRLDAVLYLLDCPTVRSVSARTFDHFVQRPLPPPEESGYLLMDVAEGVGDQEPPANVEDSLVAFIQYENGMTMVLRDFQSANMRNESKIRLYGTKQGAEFPHTLAAHEDPLLLFGEDEDGVTYDQRPQVASRHGGSHVAAYRHLFNCIREGKETLSPGERSVQVMRIVDAVYRSASEGGREIKISR